MSHGPMPDPTMMTWPQWAAEVSVRHPQARLDNWSALDWKAWGLQLYYAPTFSEHTLPDPLNFGDWKSWATRLRQTTER